MREEKRSEKNIEKAKMAYAVSLLMYSLSIICVIIFIVCTLVFPKVAIILIASGAGFMYCNAATHKITKALHRHGWISESQVIKLVYQRLR